MRVGLETTALRTKLTGVGNYTLGLANALQSNHSDIDLKSFDGIRFSSLQEALLQHLNVHGNSANALEGQLYQFARAFKPLRMAFRKAKAVRFTQAIPPLDLFHALNFMPPAATKIPCIPLVYDLSHVRFPETHPKERIEWLNQRLAKLHDYPLINTISDFSADEISEVYNYPRRQIRITSPGISASFFQKAIAPLQLKIADRVLKPGQYMLTVGTLEPRKNHRTLLEAYGQLHADERASFPLLVVGHYGWGQNDVQRAIKLREEGSLIIADYLPESLLPALYANAAAFLFPSLYEGFGMPVVEAMACGTPVIASDIPVLREVCGDTIAFVETLRAEEWCDAIRKIINMPQSTRAAVANTARIQAQIYTWQNNAAATRSMYEERLN